MGAFQSSMTRRLSLQPSRHSLFMNSDSESKPSQTEEQVRSQLRRSREESPIPSIIETGQIDGFLDRDEALLQKLKSKRSYTSIIVERFMQGIDDYQLSERIKEYKEIAKSDPIIELQSKMRKKMETREKIVVLGTGWGSHSFLKSVDATRYDITVISPRNYFLFTPMLAASAVGTVEFRSICEPIRNVNPFADYLEASALSVDPVKKTVQCQTVKCVGTACELSDFDFPYDHLLVAVGATTNTFGIKGVRENCLFLKQVEDAANLRKAIAYCFERANIPGLSDEEKRSALSFIVVGAGPTGVEFTSELRDWLEVEGRRYYPKLLKYVSLKLVEAGNAVLAVFDKALQDEALTQLTQRESSLIKDGLIDREMTTVMLKAGVKEVSEKCVELSSGEKLPYGFCVWAAGNGPIPLVLDIVEKIEQQKVIQSKARGRIGIDGWLRVAGADGVYAIGDCTFQEDNPLPATAQVASQQGAYLGRLFSKGFDMAQQSPMPPTKFVNLENESVFASEKLNIGSLAFKEKTPYNINELSQGNGKNDDSVAKVSSNRTVMEYAKPFQFLNLGVLAYIGASKALAQISVDEKLVLGSGPIGFLLWRGIYWSKQVSWRNRALVSIDWLKARIFGRDIGSL